MRIFGDGLAMALKRKMLGVSALAGLLLWVADAAVHFFFFHDEPFLDVLILAVPPHEIYVRSLGFAIILGLGSLLAVQFAKRERIEQQVRKSHGFLQTVIDAIPAATMAIGRDYQIALANRAARDMAGVEDPVAAALRCHQVSHHRDSPCSGEEHPCPLKEVIATKAPATATHTHCGAEGKEMFVEITAAPIFDDRGKVSQIIESCRNVTDRKRAEDKIRKIKDSYDRLTDNADEVIFRVEPEGGHVVYANPASERLLGYSQEEWLADPSLALKIIHPDYAGEQQRILEELNTTKKTIKNAVLGWVAKDGCQIIIEYTVIPILDEEGDIVCFESIGRDITERKRAQEERENLAKFPAEDPGPVLRVAGDGNIIFANKAAQPLLDAWSCRVGQAIPTQWADLAAHVLVTGHREDVEIECDGRMFLVTFAPVVEAGYVNLYARDITERKQADEDVRRSHEELRALASRLQAAREEERIRLARTIHDDVGHALTALKMDLAWVNRRLPKAADAPRTPKVRERLESMSKLLAETIQTARETASELRPGLLDDVGVDAAIEWEAKQFRRRTGIKCTFTGAADKMELDHEQSTALFRICQELLTNVALHAGATAVRIALKRQGDELILEVGDNGKGIRKKQISSSRSLGILGMRERALVLGGAFSISGQAGKGTTATVQIPLGEAVQTERH